MTRKFGITAVANGWVALKVHERTLESLDRFTFHDLNNKSGLEHFGSTCFTILQRSSLRLSLLRGNDTNPRGVSATSDD